MSLGQRSRSQSALKLCAKALVKHVCVLSITLSCMNGIQNNLAKIIILTRQCVSCRNLAANFVHRL